MTPHHLGNSGASRKGDDASLNDDGYESKGEDFVDFSHLFDSDQSNNPERYVLRRSSRQHKIPSKFDNYELDKKVRYDINYVMSYVNLSIYNYVFSTNLNKIHEPKTFVEAAKDPRWVEAMNLEIEALNSRKLKYFLRVEVLETDNGLCLNQRKYCIKLLSEYGMLACKPAKTPILDQSKKRKDNDEINSALKAEYRAMNSVTCKIMGILKILKDLNVNVELPVSISCDSSPAIQIAANLVFHERTKHFEIDLYFLREKVYAGLIKTCKIKSEDNVADLFTKGLSIKDHQKFCSQLSLLDLYHKVIRVGGLKMDKLESAKLP
ncbi:hypothetical protein Tco_0887413 [Tanacetum coccineum]